MEEKVRTEKLGKNEKENTESDTVTSQQATHTHENGHTDTYNTHTYSHTFTNTGGPRYMRSFYLRFCVYAIEKWPFSQNLSSNLWYFQVFLYANSLYASLFLESLSLAYNEVRLYIHTHTHTLLLSHTHTHTHTHTKHKQNHTHTHKTTHSDRQNASNVSIYVRTFFANLSMYYCKTIVNQWSPNTCYFVSQLHFILFKISDARS